MITTRRNSERTVTTVASFEDIVRKSSASTRAYEEYDLNEQVESEQQKARRFNDAIAKNFENLLYFRNEETAEAVQDVVAAPVATPDEVEDADLCPSSTTMQFREENAAVEIYHDIKKEATTSYKINTKGKLLIAVYSLVIITLFALIFMNTRALKSLDNEITQMNGDVENLQQQVVGLDEQLEYYSSEEHIIEQAKKLDMILPN